MGAVYSVQMKLIFTDETALTELMREHFKACLKKNYGFRVYNADTADSMTVRDFVEAFAPDIFFEKRGEHSLETESGFDASYSWEFVLDDMFRAIAPALADGSYMRVGPDEGTWTMAVENGQVVEVDT